MRAAILAPMPDTRVLAVVVVAVLPACLDREPPPEIASTAHEINYPVAWENEGGVDFTGTADNGLVKTGTQVAWDAGASSTQTIGRQGFVRFTTAESNKGKMLGLSRVKHPWGDDGLGAADIDYAIRLDANATVTVWVEGVQQMGSWSYASGDVFYIETVAAIGSDGQKIKYWKGIPGAPSSTHLATTNITPTQLRNDFFPLQVDTSLRHEGATLGNVVIRPTIHVGVQEGKFAANQQPDCAPQDVIVISSWRFVPLGAPGAETPADYADPSQATLDEMEMRLLDFASDVGITPSTHADILMIDNEDPPPADLHEYTGQDRIDIVEGYKVRIGVVKDVFPSAKLALYGTLNPQGRGDEEGDIYEARLQALIDAGEQGLYEQIDFLVPVLYTRFGCDDVTNPPTPDEACDDAFHTIDEYTRLGITGSRQLEKIDNTVLPLLPVVGVRVAGDPEEENNTFFEQVLLRDLDVAENDSMHPGNPANPFELTLNLQMKEFSAANPPVTDVVLWIGGSATQTLLDEEGNNSGWTVNDYTCRM